MTKFKYVKFAAVAALAFGANSAVAGAHNISQKDKQFSTAELTVKVGDTVVFKNDDATAHNVFSTTAGNAFNLKIQKPGSESSQTFATPGEIDVRCAIHPKMTLKIKVVQ